MSDTVGVQVVDLTPWREGDSLTRLAVGRQVALSMEEVGFVVLVGHGIDDATRAGCREQLAEAFALPPQVKEQYRAPALGTRGWIPFGAEANGYAFGEQTPPDLKESFVFTTADLPGHEGAVPNLWVEEVPGLRPLVSRFLEQVEAVHLELLRVCAVGLGLEDEEHFVARAGAAHNTLNCNWYPPMTHTGDPLANQYRIGPHSDFGTLTVLDRQPGLGGLQVQLRDGSWVDVPHVEGSLVINCGDLLEMWSGGRWRSARHRVLPPPADAPEESLMSLVYFCEPDTSTVIEPLPGLVAQGSFPAIRAGDYLKAKLDQITVAP